MISFTAARFAWVQNGNQGTPLICLPSQPHFDRLRTPRLDFAHVARLSSVTQVTLEFAPRLLFAMMGALIVDSAPLFIPSASATVPGRRWAVSDKALFPNNTILLLRNYHFEPRRRRGVSSSSQTTRRTPPLERFQYSIGGSADSIGTLLCSVV
jgi:hypothetical protein